MNENIRDFFDEVALDYTHDDKKVIDELLDSLHLENYHRLLDLGCGKGIISSRLADKSKGEVVALDISSKMIEFAKKEVNNLKVRFVNANFYEYKDDEFDAIICFDAFPHFMEVDSFVLKANELLRSGGLLAIMHDIGRKELNSHHHAHAKKVSRPLKEPIEEASAFLKYFEPIELFENDEIYKLILKKK